jgi:hypothetical protein
VLSWGESDRLTGHNRWPRPDCWAVRALPYDQRMQPKLVRREIPEALLAHDPGGCLGRIRSLPCGRAGQWRLEPDH